MRTHRWSKWNSNPNWPNSNDGDSITERAGSSVPVPTSENAFIRGSDAFVATGGRSRWMWEEPLAELSENAREIGRVIDRLAGEL